MQPFVVWCGYKSVFNYSLEYFLTFAFGPVAMISGRFSVYESSAVLSDGIVVSRAVEYVCVLTRGVKFTCIC